MKKIFVCFLCAIFMYSCTNSAVPRIQDETTNNNSNIENEILNKIDILQTTTEVTDDTYEFYTETQAIFNSYVRNNPIDYDYSAEPCDSTTFALIKHEQKYIEIWLYELEYSCENFSKLLTDDDRVEFERIQSNWEIGLQDKYSFVDSIIYNSTYQILAGSIFPFESANEYRKEIRERTLFIKYLQYYFENNKSGGDECPVTFNYQSKYLVD